MRIVTIGGGTGQFTLLSALKKLDNADITAIVSMSDSGGSTGRLRDEYGVLPPGDILKCLIALSPLKEAREILQRRFQNNEHLRNHNAGNLLLVFLSDYLSGNFLEAVSALGEILNIRGTVLPVTLDKATLAAELENGEMIFSESEIDVVRGMRPRIKRTFLVPHSGNLQILPEAERRIIDADYIFIGPGDFYTSITPNFLVPGVVEALKQSNAAVIFIENIMTKRGETDDFTAAKFLTEIERYCGRKIDEIVMNNALPDKEVMEKYEKEGAKPVFDDFSNNIKVIRADLLTKGELARHDPNKLFETIKKLCE